MDASAPVPPRPQAIARSRETPPFPSPPDHRTRRVGPTGLGGGRDSAAEHRPHSGRRSGHPRRPTGRRSRSGAKSARPTGETGSADTLLSLSAILSRAAIHPRERGSGGAMETDRVLRKPSGGALPSGGGSGGETQLGANPPGTGRRTAPLARQLAAFGGSGTTATQSRLPFQPRPMSVRRSSPPSSAL